MEKSPKKWSLGNILFRKSKKDIPQADFSSDDDDRKAGFGQDFIKKSPSKVKTNKQLVQNFDQQQYSVANPEFHYFKPSPNSQQQPPSTHQYHRPPQIYANQNSLELINNQINTEKNRQPQQYIYNNGNNNYQYQGSSQDEKSSYNSLSSPINKNDSETGSRTSLTKKTRSARNERYYQRIMRDDGRPVTVYGSVNSIENNNKYQPPLNGNQNRLSTSMKSSSLCSSDFMSPLNASHSLPIPHYRGPNDDDKDDYENIHEVDESMPPPIPPRDPNRRLSVNSSSISQQPYYFDHSLQKYVIFNTNGKCFSDDKLWKTENEPAKQRSFGGKPDKYDVNSNKEHDILRPRSRKPLNVNTNLDNECVFSSEDIVDNPRNQIGQSKRSKSAIDFDKIMQEPVKNKNPIRQRNLTSVEPIRYQPPPQSNVQQAIYGNDPLQALRKKYSSAEDVKTETNMRTKHPSAILNAPGSRKSFNPMDFKVREGNVSSNLDEAINELELMYKSLVKDEDLMERAERRDLPTPTKFSMMMRKYEEYENEENRNDKEPDIVLDDVFSRNLKHANQSLKVPEYQPPFGIPNQKLCPIPPKPSQDYLSVEPIQMRKSMVLIQNNPDLIADDLAVRNLRKDNPNYGRRRNLIEVDNNHFMKRNHTLSSLSDHIYNGILKDAAKPSGGKLEDYLHLDSTQSAANDSKDVKSTLYMVNQNKIHEAENRMNFEESLNALVIESKAISQKLEKDLSKLKRESVTPTNQPKTLVSLLDFRKSIEKEKEKKSTSCSPLRSLHNGNVLSAPLVEPMKPKVEMKSTGCSPITDFEISTTVEEIIKDQSPKPQKAEKIGNLIKMFNTPMSPESVNKPQAKIIEKPSRKLSDLSDMFNKPIELEKKIHAPLKKAPSIEEKCAIVASVINPRIISPTKMTPKIASPIACKKVISPNNVSLNPVDKSKHQADLESNINNIKELIQQIKKTEFDKNQKDVVKPDILKPAQNDLPDYDNIKDDYEMTDGKLERVNKTAHKPDITEPLKVTIPKEISDLDENSPDVKSMTTTSSSLRETSVESTSKDSFKSDNVEERAAIYKDAIDFLHETAETKPMKCVESVHKSPIKSIRQDKEIVLNYIDKINENLVAARRSEETTPRSNVKESITKLENKMTVNRQLSEQSSACSSDTPKSIQTPKEQSPQLQIRSVVLPKVVPSDTESQYNSSEELSMIFGIGDKQQHQQSSVPAQPGNVEDDFEAEFEKIAHDDEIIDDKILDESFNVTLIDLNNNTDNKYIECFDNELSVMACKSSAMSKFNASDNKNDDHIDTKSTSKVYQSRDSSCTNDDNNNNLTELSKLKTTNELINRKQKPSTSNNSNPSSSNSLKSNSTSKSDCNIMQSTPSTQLKTQCILLACVYCIMLYLQFIIFNFKSSN